MAKATKKAGLPEISINEGPLVDNALKATDARAQVSNYTTIEKAATKEIADLAVQIRQVQEHNERKYVGIIRITGPELPPVRVEFRLENGALPISEEENLDTVYGSCRPLLFAREKVINEIIDPLALIEELKASGKNPADYLNFSVKDGMDGILADSKHVTTGEAFLPKEGLLNTLNEIQNVMTEEGRVYTSNYLTATLKPRVVLGTAKGKTE